MWLLRFCSNSLIIFKGTLPGGWHVTFEQCSKWDRFRWVASDPRVGGPLTALLTQVPVQGAGHPLSLTGVSEGYLSE